MSVVCLNEDQGGLSLSDSKKQAVDLLVNMSQQRTSQVVSLEHIRSIKFKSFADGRENINEASQATLSGRKSDFKKSLTFDSSDEDLFNSAICYHPTCSFAYNITPENVRKPSMIAECVPQITYKRLAEVWNLDPEKTPRKFGNTCKLQNEEEENEELEEFIKSVERDLGIRSDVSEDLQVCADSIKSVEQVTHPRAEQKENPYLKFLKKNIDISGDLITKPNLRRKATKITEMIIENFLDWYQSVGGNDSETLIDDSTLQELFQIGFDLPEAKALVIGIKELPTVPECLASLKNEPEHATRYGLREILKQDIEKENIPLKMFAFGRMLPKEHPSLRYKPPRNFVKKTWMECSRVPSDLDTMKTIWVGLEKLRSTIAFANWLKEHPSIKPPTYLQKKGLLAINYEEWNLLYKGFEMEVDTTESDSAYPRVIKIKQSTENVGMSTTSFEKSDSISSY